MVGPTPVFLPGKARGQRSLVSYRPWSRKRQTWPSYKRVTFLRAPPAPEPPPFQLWCPSRILCPHPRASVCPGPLLCCLTAVTAPLCRPQLRDPRALICLPEGSDPPPLWLRAWHCSLLSSLGLAPQTSRRALVLPTRPLPWGPSPRCNAWGLPRVPAHLPTCKPQPLQGSSCRWNSHSCCCSRASYGILSICIFTALGDSPPPPAGRAPPRAPTFPQPARPAGPHRAEAQGALVLHPDLRSLRVNNF